VDYIALAERMGVDREKVIYAYRRLNGGYFMRLYYAKPPTMYKLHDWPSYYLKASKHFPKLGDKGYNEAVQVLITLDVVSILGTSSVLENKPLQEQKIRDHVRETFSLIKREAEVKSLYPFPEMGEVRITQDFFSFINDLVKKRREEDSADPLTYLTDMAYESDVMENLRKERPWARTISRKDSLRALMLSEKLEEFINSKRVEIFYIVGQRTGYIDRAILDYGIRGGIAKLVEEGERALKGETDQFGRELLRIIEAVREVSNYLK
jgi:hypothetical protein